jgi:hypothetical protein
MSNSAQQVSRTAAQVPVAQIACTANQTGKQKHEGQGHKLPTSSGQIANYSIQATKNIQNNLYMKANP